MDNFLEILKYIFLGFVQGFSEILPISSSGHLVLAQNLLKIEAPGLVFEMFTNTASFLALFLLLYKDIFRLIKHFFLYIFKRNEEYKDDFYYALKLVVSVIFIGIAGILLKDYLGNIKNLLTVGISLVITGALLLLIYYTRNAIKDHDEITFKDALVIGLFQMFAVVPGISRSGSTIIGGRVSKVSLKSILTFSFLCYIIISIPTAALGFYDLSKISESINWLGYILAFIVTFIVTFITAKLILKKLEVKHLIYFGYYCLVVGLTSSILHFIL
jgi:undecaprenyl-diphosphatase